MKRLPEEMKKDPKRYVALFPRAVQIIREVHELVADHESRCWEMSEEIVFFLEDLEDLP